MQLIVKLSVVICCMQMPWHASGQLRIGSVEEACRYALTHNYGNTLQDLQIGLAKKQKVLSNAYWYPNISAGLYGQYNIDISETPVPGELIGKPGEVVYMKFGNEFAYSAGINVEYQLLNWTSIYQSKVATANFQLALSNQQNYEQQLKEQVGQTYFASLTALHAEKIWAQQVTMADAVELLTRQKFDEGLVDQLSLNQAVNTKLQVSQQLERTISYRIQVTNQFKLLLGISTETIVDWSESIQVEKMEPISVIGLSNSQLEVVEARVRVAALEQKTALTAFAPKIAVKGSFGANQYMDEFHFSLDANDWRRSNYVGVSVSLPLFNGFANSSKYQSAKIQKNLAETALQEKRLATQLEDNSLINKYLSSIKIVNASQECVRLSNENLNAARQKFEGGGIGLTEFLEFFNANLNVQNQYLTDLSECRSLQSTIESRK